MHTPTQFERGHLLRRGSARRLRRHLLGLVLGLAGLVAVVPATATAAPACTRFAGTNGDDAGAGTPESPFRTAATLVSRLAPGDVGCLLPGVYAETLAIRAGGEPGRPIRLQSSPDGRATLRGRLWIADSANDVVVSDLLLDGRNDQQLPSPTVNGDRVAFYDNEVTNFNAPSICFVLGHRDWGIARETVLERNRIHNCGALPVTNLHHGVYVSDARDVRIVDNLIYDNADMGIQLYPDAQNTLVANNVIDGNGVGIIFSGAGGIASSGNRVVDNVITNSIVRFNVESWYPAGTPVGVDNLVSRNCIWNGAQGNVAPYAGYTVTGTVAADPLYVDRAAKNFALRPGSPCAGMGPTSAATPLGSVLPGAAPAPSGSSSGGSPVAPREPKQPQRSEPKPKPAGSAKRVKVAKQGKPLFVHRGGKIRILWGGRYRTSTELRSFVTSRGISYARWSKRHADAAAVLRSGRLPANRR